MIVCELKALSPASLLQVADSCKSHGAADTEVYPFDLVNTDDIDSLAKKILQDKEVHVLVNNAGIMTAGSVYQGTTPPVLWLLPVLVRPASKLQLLQSCNQHDLINSV